MFSQTCAHASPDSDADPDADPRRDSHSVPHASPTDTPAPVVRYSGTEQSAYIKQAQEGFVGLRSEKSGPFLEANAAMEAAGGMSPKGLTSKETIATRRDLISKTRAANEDYKTFIATQEDAYRTELQKRPWSLATWIRWSPILPRSRTP